MATKNLGVISPVHKGEWNKDEEYKELNIVRLRNATFMAKSPSISVEPLVSANWNYYWEILFTQSMVNIPSLDAIAIGQIIILDMPTNPYDLYGGGEWLQLEDVFLYGSGSKELGSTGGSETHQLTQEELAWHNHSGLFMDFADHPYGSWMGHRNGFGTEGSIQAFELVEKPDSCKQPETGGRGGSQPFSIMPPYQVVNIWKRIG